MRSETERRLDKLEASARAQIELANQIELLKAEIARLRGENEVLSNDLANRQQSGRRIFTSISTTACASSSPRSREGCGPPAARRQRRSTRPQRAATTKRPSRSCAAASTSEAAGSFIAFTKAYPTAASSPVPTSGPPARCISRRTTPAQPSTTARSPASGRTTPARPTPCSAWPAPSRPATTMSRHPQPAKTAVPLSRAARPRRSPSSASKK
jgi:hypothetical protein